MKKYFLLFVCALTLSCYTVERNCAPFHRGEFEFTTVINGTLKTSTFVRDEKYEIEYFEGKVDTSTIRWVNDCEYILTKLNPKTYQEQRPIQIKIIKTEANQYTFEYSLVGDSENRQRGIIKKLK